MPRERIHMYFVGGRGSWRLTWKHSIGKKRKSHCSWERSWSENRKPGPLPGMLGKLQDEITMVVTVANQFSVYVLR